MMNKIIPRLRGASLRTVFSCAGMLLFPAATFYLFDGYTHNPFTTMKPLVHVLNLVFFELVMLFFFGLFGRLRTALMAETGFFMLAGLANFYVLSFRAAPIMPWDLYSVGTAASVAGNFDYTLEPKTLLILAGFLLLLFLEFFCRISLKGIKKRSRAVWILLPFLLLWGFTAMFRQEEIVHKFRLYDKLFTPSVMSKRCGNSIAFLMELKYLSIDKPDGYRSQDAAAMLASYGDKEPDTGNRPNIIVIMNEAFSDLSVLGDFTTNEDYMPFIRSLQQGHENTVTGFLNVSVLGGNTANTEFEFLTGHTMAFLPQGSVAYQQYLKGEAPSLASHLKGLGYKTVAMHPYYATGWERSRVYPEIGFDEMYFKDDYKNIEYVRNYASDKTCYDAIISQYEQKGGAPMFLFNVTMQNHGSYSDDYENFTPDITVDHVDSKTLSKYLSLIKLSDQALSELIGYFEKADEDTVIVFFGDHQPTTSVSSPVRKLNGKGVSDLPEEENSLYYKVPFVVWANFDIVEASGVETSANYLGADVLSRCGLPLPGYQSFLKELEADFPVLSSQTVLKRDGAALTRTSLKESEDALNAYQSLQYYLLFDREK